MSPSLSKFVANVWQLFQLLLVLPAILSPLLSVLPTMDKVLPAQSFVKVPLKPPHGLVLATMVIVQPI